MEAKVNNFQNNAKDSNIILTSESNETDLSVKLSKIFSYNGHNVSFIKTSYGILLNATQMAKAFNKKPAEYLRLPSVNQLIKSMVGFSHHSENQIVTTMLGSPENGGGTWMFEDLAIDFARWLDTDFRLWCNSKIKEFLTSNLVSIPNFTDPAEAAEEWAMQYRRAQQAEAIALAEHKRAEQERMEKEIAVNTLEEKKGDIEFSESFKKVDHENMWRRSLSRMESSSQKRIFVCFLRKSSSCSEMGRVDGSCTVILLRTSLVFIDLILWISIQERESINKPYT